ncbi:S9 family peptidase [Phenylobacterium sp.]|uniref:S9 family peptidase n=1 Tax=Phenylobacterium sp. TaxID=1871053 RepID=UPI0025CB8285|nr:S9 family peptidase [Phenylobacterium sp.]
MLSLILAAAAAVVAAAPTSVHQYDGLALSPAGDLIATVDSVDVAGRHETPHGHVVVRGRVDSVIVGEFDPCPACRYGAPTWSPDGAALAFVATDRRIGQASIMIAEAGKLRTAATFRGLLATPRWSPDGRTLAVLATADPHKETGATQAGAARVGEIDAAPDERRIAVLPAAGGPVRMVSPGDRFVYEYDWTPDSRGFVATDARGDGDNNWWIARLEAVDLVSGAAREIAAPHVQLDQPRVSPDGRTVVFIGGLMSDFGPVGGDLYAVPFAGGTPVNVTPGFKGSFSALSWKAGGLYATALTGEMHALFAVDPASGKLKPLWSEATHVGSGDGGLALSADGQTFAAMRESFAVAPQIAAGPTGTLAQVTHDNDAMVADGAARSVTWKNEGFDVQGWLLAPPNVQPGKTYPMAVLVHGGPSSASDPRFVWEGTTHALLAHGYYVFMPNPRGSHGQGQAFTRANVQDFGGGDLRDILAGVDAVEKVAPVDDKRLAVMGGSYGGFMTMWAVTHTDRFKAGAAGAGIANWISYYGQNGIDQWMVPFFGGTAYDNPAVYDRLSPIRSIRAAKTPTFIYVGERDVECPPAQSLEFWHGLKAVGVPTSLVIYPGEGHGLRDPMNQRDVEQRTLAWFDRYLGD